MDLLWFRFTCRLFSLVSSALGLKVTGTGFESPCAHIFLPLFAGMLACDWLQAVLDDTGTAKKP